jgi:hypothetical protein
LRACVRACVLACVRACCACACVCVRACACVPERAWARVVAHKPSQGVVPMLGHVPPQPFLRLCGDLAVAGPMARCCEDLRLMLGG